MTERQFGKALIDTQTLTDRVRQLAQQISRDYEGREILAIGVLKGASIFYADLVRQIQVPVVLDFIQVKSYAGRTSSSGEVRMIAEPEFIGDMEGRHVLIVEDIVDTASTLHYLTEMLRARDPASLRCCALVRKKDRIRSEVDVDYLGFDIPDRWVVGYGLDLREQYRTLPYIGVVDP